MMFSFLVTSLSDSNNKQVSILLCLVLYFSIASYIVFDSAETNTN